MTGTELDTPPVPETAALALAEGRHGAPFDVLGPRDFAGQTWITAIDPGADKLFAVIRGKAHPLPRLHGPVFCGPVPKTRSYRLRGIGDDGSKWTYDDAYRFGPVLSDLDEYLLGEGTHLRLWEALGAHIMTHQRVKGAHFAVWAPNAQRVSVVGAFNLWDGRRHVMRRRGGTGVWEIFVPGIEEGTAYKYEILDQHGALQPLKADPVGFGSEHPPQTASIVRDLGGYGWDDTEWMKTREARNRRDAPISIYEVHLGSWKRVWDQGGRPLSYLEHAEDLVSYARDMGFTHIELMPISEFPFDGSWGYQPVGLYAPTIRFGPPHEFRDLVDAVHAAGMGLLIDWVPGHFPTDPHGLGRFDGTALYEHEDPREGFHRDWNTLIYNYGRREVANYLVANALYWLDEYHVDGLRVDAVASMLYRDYSRGDDWVPNIHGGRENLEAIDFLRRMNAEVYGEHPGIMTVAEESTAFPGVSAPVDGGGLDFGYKWNMGWMNDALSYVERDPIHRKYHHHQVTNTISWAFSENYILPISHDEVVHGKGSMWEKMPGDDAQKSADLRAFLGYMFGHPGKKLLFQGVEFGQPAEWDHDGQVDWDACARAPHAGIQALVRDLNRVYRTTPALHVKDCEPEGFTWIDASNADQSLLAFLRHGGPRDAPVLVVCNFTPIERTAHRIGVPQGGRWAETLNTDAGAYGGGDRGNMGSVKADDVAAHGHPQSLALTIPPLATLMLSPK